MEIILHIKALFKCVYLLNGEFVETADNVRYRQNEPIYITVLPLEAHLLPYTVKVMDGRALSNSELVRIYSLQGGHFYVGLSPRYNYVYSPSKRSFAFENSVCEKLFTFVKRGQATEARECMTKELRDSIDDKSLLSFFDDYIDIIPNEMTNAPENSYYLAMKNNQTTLFKFVLKGGLIDDILTDF